jgi:tRNA-Thr(GGU) m(6)t(6)A37 methyltransferase TsaA
MNDEDLGFLPATELAPMIRQKKISPVEVMASLIRRIEHLEPKINAMAAFGPELAMERARAAETALMKGAALGALHGLPVTIKDLAWTTDFPTESGSHINKGFQAKIDNPFVTRLRDAGAIVIGKTTTSEFGWTGVSRSPLTGITHNPWKQGYNAGASSAGAGAAAAAGYSALHQGSDGAGSIRMPSHFCGLFGLKPSYGRVPNHPVGAGDYTSHIGPMTRTVGDGALMMQVMSGPHPLDHTSLEAWPADYTGRLDDGVRGRRVAFSMDLGHARVDPEVAALVRSAAEDFAAQGGFTMVDVSPAWGPVGKRFGAHHVGRAHDAHGRPVAEVRASDGPRPGGLHPRWRAGDDGGVSGCADAQAGLLRRYPGVVRGLGLPDHADRLGGGLPGGEADPGPLAAACLGLAAMGGVLLSVQHVVEPGGHRAVRLHQGRLAGGDADRRAAVRRPGRDAGVQGVRAHPALGGQAAGDGLVGWAGSWRGRSGGCARRGRRRRSVRATGGAGMCRNAPWRWTADFVPGLKDVEGYTHLILLYWLDQAGAPEMVFTPPNDSEPRGMFATRTPRRPNPIGLSVVKLEGFDAPGVLRVRYLDCVDGTPLLDIKPYLPSTDCEPEASMGFQRPSR